MNLIYIKLVLLCLFTILFTIYGITLIIILGKGKDPHGTHEGYSFIPKIVLPILSDLWDLSIILYVFFTNLFESLWIFPFLNSFTFIFIGISIAFLGLFICLLGIMTLGSNYRIELPKEKTILVTHGVYHWMRNPIYFGIYLWIIGIFFIIPFFIILVEGIFLIIALDVKVRAEEKFLIKSFGKDYQEYKNKVGRYLPFPLKRSQ